MWSCKNTCLINTACSLHVSSVTELLQTLHCTPHNPDCERSIAGWNNCMLKRLRNERPVLLSWLFLCGLIVGTCSHAALWVPAGVHVGLEVVQRSGRGGCFVPKWSTCHSDMPGRESGCGHNGSKTATGIRDACSFFYALINLIHSFKIACVVFDADLLTRQTHRKMCTLYTHAQMTQSVILSAWCAETNKRLLYGAAV